ncbi:IS110 family transposase [Nesterenkonia alkaliphila]|uniref:IS110 family transposase n=2 Tax=Nesterenkonia alkaliphila TaxID=1463631 RepID=A0A7K1UIE0_9MICC|nr:IS110 family transposase [Nesterenkonia alkaliphila]
MMNTNPVTAGPVAGVDTHSETHTLAVLTAQGAVEFTEEFTTDRRGHAALLTRLHEVEGLAAVGVEGTNSYGAELARTLLAQGFSVLEVLRPTRQVRRMDGKSDPIDAIAAARQVLTGDGTSIPKHTGSPVEALRYLLVARRNLIGAASRMITVIKSLLVTAPETVREPLRSLTTPTLIDTLAASRPGTMMTDPAAAAKHTMRLLARDYQRLHAEADQLEDQMTQLVTAINPGMLEVYGSGTVTSAQLLVTAGDNSDRITTEAKFAHLCGASPIPASSGKTHRYRLNRGGDRQANSALHRIALVRMRHDPRTRAYVERRRAENLSKKDILRCLKRAIAREIHHVLLHRTTPERTDLRALRTQKQITLTDAAEALKTKPARLSEIERRTRPQPALTTRYEKWLTAA